MNFRGRGSILRGSSSKKTNLLPNLSVAGKREVKAEPGSSDDANKEKRGRGRGERRSRGSRGRGVERESRKPAYIEQTGIFSSGLNDDGRHIRPKVRGEFSTVAIARTKKFDKDVEMSEDVDLKPVTYETEWLSDEELDLEELSELLKDEFISDIKKGNVKPLVLPISDEVQFNDVVEDVVKKEIVEAGDLSSSNDLLSTKRLSLLDSEKRSDGRAVMDDELTNPTLTSSERASVLLRNVSEAKDGSLMLWQLPSTLSVFANGSTEVPSTTTREHTPKEEKKTEVQHCLKGLPSGTELGILKIRNSGRTELALGGTLTLDVTCAVPRHHQETVVMIKLEQQRKDGLGQLQGLKSEFSGGKQSENEFFVLGGLSHAIVCSHNFPQFIGMGRKKIVNLEDDKTVISEEDDEIKALYMELQRFEKKEENWKHWAREYARSTTEVNTEKD